MKGFIAVVAFATIVVVQSAELSDEQKQKITAYHKECLPISGVTQEQVDKARKGEFMVDDKFKAQLFCVSKKVGFQNEAGELQKDVIIAKVTSVLKNEETVNELYTKCAQKQATGEETAFYMIKCFHEKTPDHIAYF